MGNREELYWDCQGFPFDADWELRKFVSGQVEAALTSAFDEELSVWVEKEGDGRFVLVVAGPDAPAKDGEPVDCFNKRIDLEDILFDDRPGMVVDDPVALADMLERLAKRMRSYVDAIRA